MLKLDSEKRETFLERRRKEFKHCKKRRLEWRTDGKLVEDKIQIGKGKLLLGIYTSTGYKRKMIADKNRKEKTGEEDK